MWQFHLFPIFQIFLEVPRLQSCYLTHITMNKAIYFIPTLAPKTPFAIQLQITIVGRDQKTWTRPGGLDQMLQVKQLRPWLLHPLCFDRRTWHILNVFSKLQCRSSSLQTIIGQLTVTASEHECAHFTATLVDLKMNCYGLQHGCIRQQKIILILTTFKSMARLWGLMRTLMNSVGTTNMLE